MRKFIGLTITGLFLGAGSTTALAEVEGTFLEGTVGQTSFDIKDIQGASVNKTHSNWGLTTGYMFNNYIGAEVGYRDLGEASASATVSGSVMLYGQPLVGTASANAKADSKGFIFGVRGNWPINEQFSLNGRVGAYNWKSDANVTISGAGTWGGTAIAASGSASKSFSGTDAYWGLGARYHITKRVALGLGYTSYKMGGDVDTRANSWDLNLGYQF